MHFSNSSLKQSTSEFVLIFLPLTSVESLPGYAIAQTLCDLIKKKGSIEVVLEVLKDAPNPKDVDGMEDETSFNALKIDVFVQVLLYLGSKSFSHSFSALAK
eukprot:XP_011678072.1 PREDICTED: nuclear cap-binding protein subunit 1-like [Strongylocentrotus purpuratus]